MLFRAIRKEAPHLRRFFLIAAPSLDCARGRNDEEGFFS
jgi:hypothetical protein